MEFSGQYLIMAPRIKVWQALNDEKILKQTIFGCKKICWVKEDQLELEVEVNLTVLKKTFKGDLFLSDIEVASKYTLSGRGRGGILGKVHASANIELIDREIKGDLATQLQFNAVGGGSNSIMKLGKTIIGSSAQKIIDRFFERFAQAMKVEILSIKPNKPKNQTKTEN